MWLVYRYFSWNCRWIWEKVRPLLLLEQQCILQIKENIRTKFCGSLVKLSYCIWKQLFMLSFTNILSSICFESRNDICGLSNNNDNIILAVYCESFPCINLKNSSLPQLGVKLTSGVMAVVCMLWFFYLIKKYPGNLKIVSEVSCIILNHSTLYRMIAL